MLCANCASASLIACAYCNVRRKVGEKGASSSGPAAPSWGRQRRQCRRRTGSLDGRRADCAPALLRLPRGGSSREPCCCSSSYSTVLYTRRNDPTMFAHHTRHYHVSTQSTRGDMFAICVATNMLMISALLQSDQLTALSANRRRP